MPKMTPVNMSVEGVHAAAGLASHPVPTAPTAEELSNWAQDNYSVSISAAMSLGQDAGDLPFQMRAQTLPGAARFFTAGRGITMPEPGRSEVPYWIASVDEGRKAVQELAAQKVDIVKIWVDDRAVGTGTADVQIAPGRHTVRAQAPGRRTFRDDVAVSVGSTVRVRADLGASESVIASPWLWIAVGAIVVGAAVVGTAVALSPGEPYTPPLGTVTTAIGARP